MPDQDAASFSLTSTFIPAGANARNVLTGYLAVDAEAGNEAGKPSADYGKIRLLELPRDSTVPGPGQMSNNFSADPTVSQRAEHPRPRRLRAWCAATCSRCRSAAVCSTCSPSTSRPRTGNVVPAAAARDRRVRRRRSASRDTLDEALDQVFGGDSGADAGDAGTVTATPARRRPRRPPATGTATTPPPRRRRTGTAATARADLDKALQQANQAIADGQTALATGDFAEYGEAQDRLDTAIQDALDAEARLGQ